MQRSAQRTKLKTNKRSVFNNDISHDNNNKHKNVNGKKFFLRKSQSKRQGELDSNIPMDDGNIALKFLNLIFYVLS